MEPLNKLVVPFPMMTVRDLSLARNLVDMVLNTSTAVSCPKERISTMGQRFSFATAVERSAPQ